MSRLENVSPSRASVVLNKLYKDLERRVESSPTGLCPVDMAHAFVQLCHAQTCGKCAPCRIGLGQLGNLIKDVLDGKATMETLEVIESTALSIMESADCAIGYEAANLVYKGVTGYRDDYVEHIKYGRCICTFSQPVPCVDLCPAHVDIPGYVALVGAGRYEDALRLIKKDNPFPCTCGFICEHPCEAKCRRMILDDAVNIRGLKRVAADFAGEIAPPPCAESTGKRVAIIGGGPAGLSVAYWLQLMGHQTTVYEMLPKLGGMLRYGIPNYRFPKERLDEDINAILKTGVEVKYNVKIGEDITLQQLRDEYDATLITIGASTDKKLGLEGEDAEGIMSAVHILRQVALGNKDQFDFTGKDVVVIGGGNVSMDAVRTAKRLGAKKASIVYRRRVADMTALPGEIEGAVAEACEIQTLLAPHSLDIDENNHIRGLWVTPQMISVIKGGRASVKASGAENVYIPCDAMIVAIGQNIETEHFKESGVPIDRWNDIYANKAGTFDNMPDVFSAGDCVSGPASVISAIGQAKTVAANIDEYLGYHHEITVDVEIPAASIADRTPCGRVNLTEREACERVKDFEGVENGMTLKEAQQEASRCLRCDHFGYGLFRGGREKLW